MECTLLEYLEQLAKRYQLHYNVETNKFIGGQKIDVFALSIIEHYRNVLTKKIKIDCYQEKEFVLVQGWEKLVDEVIVNNFSQFLVHTTQELVIPSFEVMSHILNGIIVSTQGFTPEAISAGQNFKYSKTFFLGIKGWCDIRLVLIDIKHNCVFCNAKGREIAQLFIFQKEMGGDRDKEQKVIH